MLVKTRGWIGFSPFLLSSKERGKVGEFPGGGGGTQGKSMLSCAAEAFKP